MSEKTSNQNLFRVDQTLILNLQNEWRKILLNYSADEIKINQIIQILIEKYSEDHRAYHNLSHINYLLEEAKKIAFDEFDSVFLTIWFHDAIYEPKKNDNEIESAKLAVRSLSELNFPADKLNKIEKIILATQNHSAANLNDDGKIFLDLDLSILGAASEIYQRYSRAIRQEYSHVPEELYRRGRSGILEIFLNREVIYFNENLRQRFEKQARLNLANEIKELS